MGYGPVQGVAQNPHRFQEVDDPDALVDTGQVYTNDIGGRTEFMYQDDTGAEVQITELGALKVPAGVTTFLGLSDTPAPGAYTGSAGFLVRVNATPDALEFLDPSADFLTQYALLAGRAGGQTLTGGINAGDDLTLVATANATPGDIIFETEPGVENARLFSTGVFRFDAAAGGTTFIDVDSANNRIQHTSAGRTQRIEFAGGANLVDFTFDGSPGGGYRTTVHIDCVTTGATLMLQRSGLDKAKFETDASDNLIIGTLVAGNFVSFLTDAGSERARITPGGEYGIGVTNPGITGTTNGVGALLQLGNVGTIPTGTLTGGGALLYATAGEMHILDAAGNDILLAPPATARAKQSVGSVAIGTSFTAITGASITLTVPGTYRLEFHARGSVDAPAKFCTFRLFDVTGAAAVPDTEAISGFDNIGTFTSSQNMGSMVAFVTITESTTYRLEGKGNTATGCASTDDTNGRTVISAHRL